RGARRLLGPNLGHLLRRRDDAVGAHLVGCRVIGVGRHGRVAQNFLAGSAPGHPAGTVQLRPRVENQGAGGHRPADRRTGGDVSVITDGDRCHQLRVTADLHAIADDGTRFAEAVVVARDRTGADIGVSTDLSITEISVMIGIRPGTEDGVLGLYKIPDMHAGPQARAGAQLRERTYLNIVLEYRIGHDHTELDVHALAQR